MTITEIKTLINDLIDTNDTDFPDAKKVRFLNMAQDYVVNIILENDKLNAYDDNSYGDLSTGYLDISNGISQYDISEDENYADLLYIVKIWVLVGTEYELLDRSTEIELNSGIPNKFKVQGKTITISPIPNFSVSNGLKIEFIRKPKQILISDTTKKPSIPSTFHKLLALYSGFFFARAKQMTVKNDIYIDIQKEEQRLGIHIKGQDRNYSSRLTANIENCK